MNKKDYKKAVVELAEELLNSKEVHVQIFNKLNRKFEYGTREAKMRSRGQILIIETGEMEMHQILRNIDFIR